MKREIEALLQLIQESPTAFQAVAVLGKRLKEAGYTELRGRELETQRGRKVFYDKKRFGFDGLSSAAGEDGQLPDYCEPQRFPVL